MRVAGIGWLVESWGKYRCRDGLGAARRGVVAETGGGGAWSARSARMDDAEWRKDWFSVRWKSSVEGRSSLALCGGLQD